MRAPDRCLSGSALRLAGSACPEPGRRLRSLTLWFRQQHGRGDCALVRPRAGAVTVALSLQALPLEPLQVAISMSVVSSDGHEAGGGLVKAACCESHPRLPLCEDVRRTRAGG